jgi:hypothetical protein
MAINTDVFEPDQLQREIAAAQAEVDAGRLRLLQLKRSAARQAVERPPPYDETAPGNDWLPGAKRIAQYLGGEAAGWTAERVGRAFRQGRFHGAVWKTGWRTMVGSRRRLDALPETCAASEATRRVTKQAKDA